MVGVGGHTEYQGGRPPVFMTQKGGCNGRDKGQGIEGLNHAHPSLVDRHENGRLQGMVLRVGTRFLLLLCLLVVVLFRRVLLLLLLLFLLL